MAYGAIRDRAEGRWFGLALFAAPFVVLLTNPLSVTEAGGGPIRIPVLLMVAFIVAIAILLGRVSRVTALPEAAAS